MSNKPMQYKLKPCEMETTIRWDRQERVAHIFTADPFMIRKFDKLCENSPQVWSCVWTDDKYEARSTRFRTGTFASEDTAQRRRTTKRNWLQMSREDKRNIHDPQHWSETPLFRIVLRPLELRTI